MAENKKDTGSCIASSFPVWLPEDHYLLVSSEEFDNHIECELRRLRNDSIEAYTAHSELGSLSLSIDKKLFMPLNHPKVPGDSKVPDIQNRTFTANLGIAHSTTCSALLDLFTELEKSINPGRLEKLLKDAWNEDPLATLKIVWNNRSIHLGKGERDTFYRCFGWLTKNHPETALRNLPYLYRSIIESTTTSTSIERGEDEFEIIEATDDSSGFDASEPVLGGAHGYWKDIANILVLAAHGRLDVFCEPREVLNKPNENGPKSRKRRRMHKGNLKDGSTEVQSMDAKVAKTQKHERERLRHANIIQKLQEPFYRLLHLSVARQFATQLRKDKLLLESNDKKGTQRISLAAKWAPSVEGFHDKHTILASSIAEILYPRKFFQDTQHESREGYLKRARAAYHRLTLAPLRKVLKVVERDISAETFAKIRYARVPSLAMDSYKDLFVRKDFDHFKQYIEKVAQGKSHTNASVLDPSQLVRQARLVPKSIQMSPKTGDGLLNRQTIELQSKTLDGQWKNLVQKTKEAGKLTSAIAICDVSGSMTVPIFHDKTVPIDTSIGLALLIAEVTPPPFGGRFITFSKSPQMINVGGFEDHRSFGRKIAAIENSGMGFNTDFIAVFDKLLLPLAIENKTEPADMVKTIFVFSDMQFDAAETSRSYPSKGLSFSSLRRSKRNRTTENWETAHERIKRKYEEHGYELPRLVYWNINGGYYAHPSSKAMPKPATKDTSNTFMVSGYSSALLKMFLEGSTFEGRIEDEDMEEVVLQEDGTVEVHQKIKNGIDPMDGVWRAISHKAYDGLIVVD